MSSNELKDLQSQSQKLDFILDANEAAAIISIMGIFPMWWPLLKNHLKEYPQERLHQIESMVFLGRAGVQRMKARLELAKKMAP